MLQYTTQHAMHHKQEIVELTIRAILYIVYKIIDLSCYILEFQSVR